MERSDWSRNKFGKWDLVELEGEHYSCCKTPWPAKYYACSFCKREFRSAQALGGHMNVHRKDRARLRLLSSWVLESQNPNKPNSNPNPNSNSINSSPSNSLSSHLANFSVYSHHSSLSTHFANPSSSVLSNEKPRRNLLNPQLGEDLSQEKTMTPFPGVKNLKMHAQNYELEVGGLRRFNDSKQVLDLELRLGHI